MLKIPRRTLIGLVIVICAAGTATVVRAWVVGWRSKVEWSELQTLEYSNRDSKDRTRLVLSAKWDGCFAGILGRDEATRTWILLNARYDPVLKRMPSGVDFEISTDEFARIDAFCGVNRMVKAELERHVRHY